MKFKEKRWERKNVMKEVKKHEIRPADQKNHNNKIKHTDMSYHMSNSNICSFLKDFPFMFCLFFFLFNYYQSESRKNAKKKFTDESFYKLGNFRHNSFEKKM